MCSVCKLSAHAVDTADASDIKLAFGVWVRYDVIEKCMTWSSIKSLLILEGLADTKRFNVVLYYSDWCHDTGTWKLHGVLVSGILCD